MLEEGSVVVGLGIPSSSPVVTRICAQTQWCSSQPLVGFVYDQLDCPLIKYIRFQFVGV